MADSLAILIGAGVGVVAAIPTALLLVALLRLRQAQGPGQPSAEVRIWPPEQLLLEDGDEQD